MAVTPSPKKLRGRTLAACGLAVASIAGGCVACYGGTSPKAPSAPSAEKARETPTATVTSDATPSPKAVPTLHVVLDDPRVEGAKNREQAKDFVGASHAFDDVYRTLKLSAEEDCAWSYVAGRLRLAAGDLLTAATAFDRVTCERLRGHALVRASEAYARAGLGDDAMARARAVPDGIALKDEAKLVLAELLASKGDKAAALPIWREVLAASPHGPRWVDTSVRIASALLDGVEGEPATHAREAFDLATRVVVEGPKLADSSGASAARARAAAVLRTKDPSFSDALTDAEHLRIAQAWLDSGDPPRAILEANALLKGMAASKPPVTGGPPCKAATVRATATPKAHGAAADAWTDAITACEGEDGLVVALYSGGKASLAAKRTQEGVDRLAKVEQLFPKHRFADDARFHAALALKDSGDEPRSSSMMTTLADDYPEGDMRGEATFRVALAHIAKGEWDLAKEPLERTMAANPTDRHWATAGRAAYFRARASAAAGDMADARKRYAEIVTGYPLAFYMTQAYARLAAQDATFAKQTLDEAVSREEHAEPTSFPSREHAEMRTPAFERACALLEVGEIDSAKKEMTLSGALAEGVDPEVVWVVGALYNRAGAPELGHAVSRAKVTDHLAHYPVGHWRVPWEVAFPRAFEPLVVKESAANGIPAPLTWAIMREESDFYPEAKSPSNAFGLMQLIVPTAKWMAAGTAYGFDEVSLKRPEVSVAFGAKLLGTLRGNFAVNPALAIAAYNGGGGAVGRWVTARPTDDFDLWVEEIPWDETRNYIKRVLASEAAYAFLYEKSSLPEILTIPPRTKK